ncbi:bet_lambda, phage recombination protein Bet [uncultured Caudovirales phage]|uniref:Bet_lambda, phage recombination protein Bet n=1 Tax=uncultured Caudovirales phage TaxID=2100421 RepID=A0A6J5LV74_9CAUD|nr:bet_lambda, phage recombination protein Bet [uncultured Caudovirales phage]
MNTELAKTNGNGSYPVAAPSRWVLSSDDYELIKNQIGKDLTDGELKLFVNVAQARGLNPLLNQIYAIRRYKNEKRGSDWVKIPTMTIQTAIEGFIIIAERTGRYEGCKTWTSGSSKELKAHAVVYKKGSRDIEVEIDWEEFKQSSEDKSGNEKLQGMWAKMPKWMLQKVALARALSRAFPEDLSGLYTTDEMPSVEPQKEVTGPAATLTDVELINPPAIETPSVEALPNPWLYIVKRKNKSVYLYEFYEKDPDWFGNAYSRWQHAKQKDPETAGRYEEEYANIAAALENMDLMFEAKNEVELAKADWESRQAAMKGERNE